MIFQTPSAKAFECLATLAIQLGLPVGMTEDSDLIVCLPQNTLTMSIPNPTRRWPAWNGELPKVYSDGSHYILQAPSFGPLYKPGRAPCGKAKAEPPASPPPIENSLPEPGTYISVKTEDTWR